MPLGYSVYCLQCNEVVSASSRKDRAQAFAAGYELQSGHYTIIRKVVP